MALASREQIGYIVSLRKQAGIDHDDLLTLAEQATGLDVITRLDDLTTAQASKVIDALKEEIGG